MCHGHRATIVGTNGPDTLIGTSHRDVIAGLGGGDRVDAHGGGDIICGGGGNDALDGDGGTDTIVGGGGHDFCFTQTKLERRSLTSGCEVLSRPGRGPAPKSPFHNAPIRQPLTTIGPLTISGESTDCRGGLYDEYDISVNAYVLTQTNISYNYDTSVEVFENGVWNDGSFANVRHQVGGLLINDTHQYPSAVSYFSIRGLRTASGTTTSHQTAREIPDHATSSVLM
jgi:hypothetical protein